MIQPGRLEGFYWVAKTKGYSKAARAFPYPISQPGVFQQVRRLEDDLGVKLFERVGKDKVVLTAPGQRLFDVVAPFLERLPGVEAELKGQQLGGRLTIHASPHLVRHFLPAWLRKLHGKRPDIEVALSEVKTADVQLLKAGECDLLVDHLGDVPADVETKEVARLQPWLVAPSDHPLAASEKLDARALGDATFIAYHSDLRSRTQQLDALAAQGVKPQRLLFADTAESILGFVAAGLGYSLVPWLPSAGPRVAGVVAHRVTRPQGDFSVVAAWRKSANNPLVRAALELL